MITLSKENKECTEKDHKIENLIDNCDQHCNKKVELPKDPDKIDNFNETEDHTKWK